GGVTPWNPGADGQINALAVSGTAVYAGGYFTTIGGEPRRNLAAIDFSGGVAGWNPNPNGTVYALAVAGANVCVGGSFGSVGGQSRSNLAAIDIMTGNATSWNPNPGGTVHALAVAGTNVYLGGSFTTIGTKARNRLGAVGITTSSATDWNPDADDTVYALAASGTAVYAGGRFNNIGGQARSRIAGLDPVTGAATSWSPNPSNTVRALAVSGLKVHAGGEFTAFRSVSRPYYAQFDLPETSYLLSYLAGTGGSVTGTKVQSVAHGGDGVEVEAVPAAGYHFLYWSDGVMTTRRVDTNVTGNLTVAAVFEGNPYTLEYTAGPGGTLSGETAQIVNHRSSGTAVRAVPDTGYHFVRWSDGSTRNPRTDTSDTGNISVTAEFAINTFLLTYLSEVGGSIAGESRQTVDYGAASAPVEAVPNPGYRFVQWSDGFVQNLRTDENIRGDLVVRAEFAVNLHTLAYTAGPGGALSGAALQTVAYGASGAAVEAVPAVGRHFVRWSDGVATARRTDANVAGDLAVMAEFAINQYVLSYAADVNGAVTGPTPQTVDHGQDGASVTAVPDTGHHFVRWSDGSTQNPRTDLNVAGDVDVTAKFALNRYTLTYRAGANGTITGTAPQEVNHGEDGAPVEAVPDTGYRFVVWSDGSAQNPRTDLNVTADLTVTAAFAVSRHTLSYTAGGGGSILGASTQTVPYGSGGTAVEAVPEEGYHFVQWSDGSVGNPRLDVNVTADLAVAAEFAVNTYTLNYTAGAGGAILGAAAQTVPYGSGGTAVEAVPEEGYHFVQWSDGSVENPRLDLEVTSDLSVTAEFAADSPEGEGEGEGEPPVPPTAEEARALLAAGLVAADTDGDGSISFAEAAAAVEGLTRAVFDELDANADGVLDRAELGLDAGDGCGCGCVKSDFSPAGLRKRLGDLFLAGLALGLLAVWGARRK
ncbi:MAG: hypothetical protein GX580_10485, partial [Candidatus Hydrogenedens sp.]|nr:hypothetical protein [Candidatus Hydrogenedens sp.]